MARGGRRGEIRYQASARSIRSCAGAVVGSLRLVRVLSRPANAPSDGDIAQPECSVFTLATGDPANGAGFRTFQRIRRRLKRCDPPGEGGPIRKARIIANEPVERRL